MPKDGKGAPKRVGAKVYESNSHPDAVRDLNESRGRSDGQTYALRRLLNG